jgi:transposase-like protein
MKCSYCNSKHIIKNGRRKSSRLHNQKYLCTNCGKQFSLKQGKFDHSLVLFAVNNYNSGISFAKTADLVKKKFKTPVDSTSISRWVKKYGSSYLKIRNELLEKNKGIDVISSKIFVHSGVIYPFMIHNHKLNEFCKFEGLKNYLLGMDLWVDRYFNSGNRCSQLQNVANVEITKKKNFLCKAVDQVLDACVDLKERHPLVQKHLLYNDIATIAVEVPVFMIDKRIGEICGHIDIIQVRYGKVWVIDYKPNTAAESKEKVSSQLYWYSRALSFRAKVPLENIRCAYFDEQVCIEFDPNKVKLKYGKSEK